MKSSMTKIIASAFFAAVLAGCASTPSSVSDDSGVAADYNPSLAMTVAANSIDSWPFSPIKFAYKLGGSTGTDSKGVWSRSIGEATVQRFETLGMTYVESEAEADYLITTTLMGEGDDASKLFSNIDVGVKAQQKGSVGISVLDRLTNRVVWEGLIEAYSDFPIATASQRQFAARQLIEQLTMRLPKVD
jgi:hypothetical protein